LEKELHDDIKNHKEDNGWGNISRTIRSWAVVIIAAFVCAWVVNNYIIINAYVPTGSMENAIMPNDRVVANRLAYLNSEPQRFDIIVFPAPDDPNTLYVKRIIGMPGETINIINGTVFINDYDEPLDDLAFVRDPYLWTQSTGPFFVPEGAYFVMGDNSKNSRDSRSWQEPFVRGDDILGQVIFRYFRGFKIF